MSAPLFAVVPAFLTVNKPVTVLSVRVVPVSSNFTFTASVFAASSSTL